MQLPIGWLADRSSNTFGQLGCALMLLLGTLAIPFSQPFPWLAAIVVFLWGGAIGGMNTLAVIEAGNRVGEDQMSTAMAAIAMSYTLGSVLGPIATGATVSAISEHDLMISVGGSRCAFHCYVDFPQSLGINLICAVPAAKASVLLVRSTRARPLSAARGTHVVVNRDHAGFGLKWAERSPPQCSNWLDGLN